VAAVGQGLLLQVQLHLIIMAEMAVQAEAAAVVHLEVEPLVQAVTALFTFTTKEF
jgi:hypothetical protein